MKLELLEARQFYADFFYGEHHLPSIIKPWGEGWYVVVSGSFATTDFNELTRLVLMAHARAIRVEISTHGGFGHMKLILHKREHGREEFWAKHPTIEQAIGTHTKWMEEKKDHYKVNPSPESEQYVTMTWKQIVKARKLKAK